jgi:hypothetical protein
MLCCQAGVIQTIYDIVKVHKRESSVESEVDERNPDAFGKEKGFEFIITLPFL